MSDPVPSAGASGARSAAELVRDEAAARELHRSLRRLARRLVGGEDGAEDVVQDAWLAALDRPARGVRDPNAWLRGVVANLAARRRRRARRRREVEALAAAHEAVESEAHFVEQVSTYRLLHRATRELREPYRGVLTERFFEERGVDEIARRSGRSAATVRSQIHRGLEELRAELDRRHRGDRAAWATLFLALPEEEAEAATVPALVSSKTILVALLALGLPAVLFVAWRLAGRAEEPAALEVARADRAPEPTGTRPPPASSARAPLAAEPTSGTPAAEAAPTSTDATAAKRRLEVLVLRADGSPARDAVVEYAKRIGPLANPVRADSEGVAVIELELDELIGPPRIAPPHPGLVVRGRDGDDAWSLTYQVPIPPEGRRIELRSGGPAGELRGTVVDESGAPVADATIVIDAGRHGLLHGEDGITYGFTVRSTPTDARGGFRFTGLAVGMHLLQIEAPGRDSFERLFEQSDGVMEERFVLARGKRVVSGRVLYPDGSPAAGARVWQPDPKREGMGVRHDEAHADEHGRYALVGLEPGLRHVFAADPELPGLFAAGVVDVPEAGTVEWDARLEEDPGIRLRIEDEHGAPCPKALVSLYRLEGDPPWAEIRYTDAAGEVHFPFTVADDVAFLLRVTAGDSEVIAVRDPLRPSPELVVHRLAPRVARARLLRGVLLDRAGAPFPGAVVLGVAGDEWYTLPVDPTSGEFRIGELAVGRYELVAIVPGAGAWPLGAHELAADAELDLGVLRAPRPLAVRIELDDPPPSADAPWVLEGGLLHTELPPKAIRLIEAPTVELALLPGSYLLRPAASTEHPGTRFELRAGEKEPVRVPHEPRSPR